MSLTIKKSQLFQIIREEMQFVLKEQYNDIEMLANKYIDDNRGEKFIAYNESYWQWEYDMDIVHAFLYIGNIDFSRQYLKLVIIREHVKSGIGAGTKFEELETAIVGTKQNPKLSQIRAYLKKYGHERTRAGYPFPKLWKNPNKNFEKEDLKLILSEN